MNKLLKTLLICGSAVVSVSVLAQNTPQQAQDPVKGAVLKNKAPVNREPLKVTLPKPVTAKLDNGLEVVLIEDHKQPTFVMQLILVDRGDAVDPKGMDGLADTTATLLREGTTTRTSAQVAQELDTLGGGFSAGSSTLDTAITLSGLTESLDPLLAIYADVIQHPTFPQTELDQYKPRILSELQSLQSNPRFLVQEKFAKAIYGDHPAGTVAPSEASINAITVDALKEFHGKYYRPNGAMLLVSGDLTLAQLQPKLQKAFGEWQRGDVPKLELPPIAPTKRAVYVINRPGSVQTSLTMGELGIDGRSSDRYALSVTNQILGGGPASRLFLNLREDKGYTYGASSSASVGRFPGTFSAGSEVRTEVTAGAMHEFMYELNRIGTDPVGDTELENAKRAIVGRFALSLENPRSFLGNVYEQETLGLPSDYWDHYAERIAAVSAAEVKRVAATYLDPTRLQIVAVGDAEKIEATMKEYEKAE